MTPGLTYSKVFSDNKVANESNFVTGDFLTKVKSSNFITSFKSNVNEIEFISKKQFIDDLWRVIEGIGFPGLSQSKIRKLEIKRHTDVCNKCYRESNRYKLATTCIEALVDLLEELNLSTKNGGEKGEIDTKVNLLKNGKFPFIYTYKDKVYYKYITVRKVIIPSGVTLELYTHQGEKMIRVHNTDGTKKEVMAEDIESIHHLLTTNRSNAKSDAKIIGEDGKAYCVSIKYLDGNAPSVLNAHSENAVIHLGNEVYEFPKGTGLYNLANEISKNYVNHSGTMIMQEIATAYSLRGKDAMAYRASLKSKPWITEFDRKMVSEFTASGVSFPGYYADHMMIFSGGDIVCFSINDPIFEEICARYLRSDRPSAAKGKVPDIDQTRITARMSVAGKKILKDNLKKATLVNNTRIPTEVGKLKSNNNTFISYSRSESITTSRYGKKIISDIRRQISIPTR